MKTYGAREDDDGVVTHLAVADVAVYDRAVALYTRTVGAGVILCEQMRANKPGQRRLIRLTASFEEAGTAVTAVCICESELDEQRSLERLDKRMRAALVKPSGS
jgi:hypothetical protein